MSQQQQQQHQQSFSNTATTTTTTTAWPWNIRSIWNWIIDKITNNYEKNNYYTNVLTCGSQQVNYENDDDDGRNGTIIPTTSVVVAVDANEKLNWERAISTALHLDLRSEEIIPTTTINSTSSFEISSTSSNVVHIQQDNDWDCGIACLLMTFRWIGIHGIFSILRQKLLDMADTQSIWTIDLVSILDQFQKVQSGSSQQPQYSYLFSSRSLSVNPNFSNYPYYSNSFERDRIRVQQRFYAVPKTNIVQQRRLDIQQIIELIQRPDCIAIVLVDNTILNANTENEQQNITTTTTMPLTTRTGSNVSSSSVNYTGHYIILVSICCDPIIVRQVTASESCSDRSNRTECCFMILNPGSDRSSYEYLSIQHFERAWRAPGTDEDIIFVRKNCIVQLTY